MRTMIMDVEGAAAAAAAGEKEAALRVEEVIIRDVALEAWIRSNKGE